MDPHKDHKCHKDLTEEKDDQSSPTIIPKEDSNDEEAPDEELIMAEPNLEVYKPPVPYPHLLSRPGYRQARMTIHYLRPLDRSLSPFH